MDVVLPALALAPFVYPFAIALLFGNVDAWFPFAYGAFLLAVLSESRRWRIVGGIALGLAALAKLYPGLLLGWLAVRGLVAWVREGRVGMPAEWRVLAVAVVTDLVAVGVSLVVGGVRPWQDYVDVLRAGTGADFVSNLNIGPASQLALALGDPAVAARVAPIVALVAIVATAAVAWRVGSAAVSLAVATILSLILSPITWFHYPVALLPFAAWAWIAVRHGNGRGGGGRAPGRGGRPGRRPRSPHPSRSGSRSPSCSSRCCAPRPWPRSRARARRTSCQAGSRRGAEPAARPGRQRAHQPGSLPATHGSAASAMSE